MRTEKIALSLLLLSCSLGGLVVVGTGCAGTRYERSTGAYLDDKGITTRVKTALFRDPNVSGFDVHVNTFRGDVQLSGFVDTDEQKQHAASLAQQVSGVRQVTNNLEVKPPRPAMGTPGSTVQSSSSTVSGPAIETPAADSTAVTPAPIRDPQDTDRNYLRNAAPQEVARDRSAANTPAAPSSSAPRADVTSPLQTSSSSSSDAPSSRLSSARGDHVMPRIDMNSTDGKVILRGTVSSEDEKRSIATKLLAIPGVVSVDNQLEVRPAMPNQ